MTFDFKDCAEYKCQIISRKFNLKDKKSYSCSFQMARLYKMNHGKGWTDTPIAFQQSGGIRTSINASSQEGKYISKQQCSLNTIFLIFKVTESFIYCFKEEESKDHIVLTFLNYEQYQESIINGSVLYDRSI
jgi:hypothetical protein